MQFAPDTLDFGVDAPLVLNQPTTHELTMTNRTINKLKFRFEPTQAKECSVEFNPPTGVIAPGKDKRVKVSLILLHSTSSSLKSQVVVESTPYFVGIRIRCASGVFGADPASLDLVEDATFKVPQALVLMKEALLRQKALQAEGIFRLAGEVAAIARIKQELNNKTFTTSDDTNAVATLIKVWFREMPRPLLQTVPTDAIFNAAAPDACSKAFASLPQPERDLLGWLMDLLLATCAHQAVNKMSPQNLSICVAPNLYDVSSSDPMEGLVLSQKVVVFLTNLLNWQIADRKLRADAAAAPSPPAFVSPNEPQVTSVPDPTAEGRTATPAVPTATAELAASAARTEAGTAPADFMGIISPSGYSLEGSVSSDSTATEQSPTELPPDGAVQQSLEHNLHDAAGSSSLPILAAAAVVEMRPAFSAERADPPSPCQPSAVSEHYPSELHHEYTDATPAEHHTGVSGGDTVEDAAAADVLPLTGAASLTAQSDTDALADPIPPLFMGAEEPPPDSTRLALLPGAANSSDI